MGNLIQKSLFPRLPLLTEERVNAVLEPIYPHLWRIVMEPWLEFLHYRETDTNFSDFEEEDAAHFLHSLIKARMKVIFENNPLGATVKNFCRIPTVVIPDQFAITFKKLKMRRRKGTGPEELTRSHYDTERSRKYWCNEPVKDGPTEPRIIVGYRLLHEVTAIRIMVACPRGTRRGCIWSYPMPEQSNSILQVRYAEELVEAANEGKGFTIENPDISREVTANG